jgi:hypothetical protein
MHGDGALSRILLVTVIFLAHMGFLDAVFANDGDLLKKLAMFYQSSCASSRLMDAWKCPCLYCTTGPDNRTCKIDRFVFSNNTLIGLYYDRSCIVLISMLFVSYDLPKSSILRSWSYKRKIPK